MILDFRLMIYEWVLVRYAIGTLRCWFFVYLFIR